MTAPSKLSVVIPLSAAVVVLLSAAACKPSPLSDVVAQSKDGAVRVHAPAGPGWQCSANDEDKEGFLHRGVKCIQEAGLVLNAKLYEVDTANARTADVFCLQDWKTAYAGVFRLVVKSEAKLTTWRGVPACEVVLEGTTAKGAWRLWELHAPNGRKLLQLSASGLLSEAKQRQPVIDAWLADLAYDLSVPGQPAAP